MEFCSINSILLKLLLTCGVLLLTVDSFTSNSAYDRSAPGETFPDKVEIEIGDNANISCRMNLALFPNRTSNDLYFFDSETQEAVPASDIAIWNESTIVFMLRNAVEQQKNYICKIDSDAIMETKVYVGTRPKPVRDFSCRSYDFEFMVCNFTQPHNTILTPYNLTFYTLLENYRYQMSCNTDEKPLIVCNATQSQIYNPKVEHYHFRLTGSNTLETREFSYEVNNWNSMIPARPGVDFRVVELSTDTLQLAWQMPKYDFYKRRGKSTLQWEIILKPDGFAAQNLSDNEYVMVFSRNEIRLSLTVLKYAYYWYELSIRVRVRYASLDGDSMWSEAFVYPFRTAASRPVQAPRTDVGSFYVDATETQVRLYWEQLPDYKKNGPNFSYVISEIKQNGKFIQLQPLQLELNSAKFPWQKDAHYEFTIKSRNHVGESLEESLIQIFPMTDRNLDTHIPRVIQNVYHATNRTYTLTWQAPNSIENLQDFTVFWCHSKRALQNECEGSIYFKHLNKDIRKFITDPQAAEHEHKLNLAVSANYLNYNAGMHWTACNMDVDNDLVRMEPEIQAISNHSIRVQWSSGSVCPSILDGYNLTYCEMDSNMPMEQAICLVKPIVIQITDQNAKQYILDKLKPYTVYKIDMFMYSRMKVGKSSDPIFIRTEEAAPTEPRYLQESNVLNTSAIISWLPPSQPNGKLRRYIVNLNNERRIVKPNEDDRDPGAKIVYELRNLSSYTDYKVFVTAETVNKFTQLKLSSPTSNDRHFTTLIGYPSLPGSAIPIRDTSSNITIQWSKPLIPSGRVDFYEVAVIVNRSDELIRKRISIVMGATSCAVKIPICIDHEYKTILKVRAVNAAEKPVTPNDYYDSVVMDDDEAPEYYEYNDDLSCIGGEIHSERIQSYRNRSRFVLFKSPWQHGPTYGCSANRLSKITIIALMVVVFALCLMTAVYFARKKYNKMANIDCTLPPGLESYPTKIGIDNETLDKRELEHHRSKELIFHNEKHHLLASACNDSGYLGDGRALTNGGADKILDYMRTTSESSTDSMVESSTDSVEPHIEKNTEYLNMANIQKSGIERCNENQSLHILPVSNGYIKPNKIINWQTPDELPTTSHCGGYVSLGSIGLAPLNANGYVQPEAIQKCFLPSNRTSIVENIDNSTACFNNGYTTLDELGKRTVNAPQQEDAQATGGAGNANPSLISGYVTQRDLTAFGQQHFT